MDTMIEHPGVQDPRVQRLRSVPSVGPVTAAAFITAIDDEQRLQEHPRRHAVLRRRKRGMPPQGSTLVHVVGMAPFPIPSDLLMSLRLLACAGRRLAGHRTLLVATARDEDLARAPFLGQTLGELERDQRVVRMRLAPLFREDTMALTSRLVESGPMAAERAAIVTHDRIREVAQADHLAPHRLSLPQRIAESLEARGPGPRSADALALGTLYRAAEVWDKANDLLRATPNSTGRRGRRSH